MSVCEITRVLAYLSILFVSRGLPLRQWTRTGRIEIVTEGSTPARCGV